MEQVGLKVIDGFVFYNEFEILEFRLHELNNIVDYFVLVEANKTFSGDDKPLFFNENKERFKPFLDKIIHVVVDDLPETDDPWVREKFQRAAIKRGLDKLDLSPNDIFILSDCDEIPDVETIKKYRDENIQGVHALEQDLYYYNLNCRFSDVKWYHSKIMRYADTLNYHNIDSIRLTVQPVLPRGGWHFTYFGDIDFIINKIKKSAHQEYNTEYYTSQEFIKNCVDNRLRIAGPGTIAYTEIADNDYLPREYKRLEIAKSKRKITQVSPGLISIPPNGWGAIEKIIWNYKLELEKLDCEVNIKYVNHVTKEDGLVHVHVANQALELRDKGIPYIFSLHDHHVVHYGKGSYNYNINLEAIKHSVISITHAEFLVDYFDETDKLFYLPHGVDTEFFKSDGREKTEHKLLCLANNGMAGNSSIDRKGFLYAIEAAKALDLPITVAGPTDNLEFFKHYPEHVSYEKLTLRCDSPNEEEILELYRSHTTFLHPSSLEAGHPNLTLLEALSTGLPVAGTYDGKKDLGGMVRIQRNTDSVVQGIIEISEHYENFLEQTQATREEYSWSKIVKRLFNMYESVLAISKDFNGAEARHAYINAYEDTKIEYKEPVENLEFNVHFVDGPFFELKGNSNKKYKVQFIDEEGKVHYEDLLGCNMWIRLNRKYFTKWTCKVYDGEKLVYNYTLNLENQRVLIGLDSKSLGDTLAWFPYLDEFRKKHKCKVIASTFWNKFFKDKYPEIDFVEPGEVVHNLMAKYDIGWFYDVHKEPALPNTIPLQKTATNILGLEYSEVLPILNFNPGSCPYGEKYVAIATASTAGLKYWTHEGWTEVVKFLKKEGYRVIHVSKESTDLDVEQLKDTSIENTMNVLHHAEFFIGLSSGLSWLAWALNKRTVMISNFTTADHEFSTNCLRITDTSLCHGCWNDPQFTFDRGDWNWCPKHKNTERHFECHRKISSETVIEKIKTLL